MAIEAKVRKIGNSLGIVLPKKFCKPLKSRRVHPCILRSPKCGIQVNAEKPHLEKMQVTEDAMRRYGTFRSSLSERAHLAGLAGSLCSAQPTACPVWWIGRYSR